MFEGFAPDEIDAGEAVLRVRHGGSGPAGAVVARTPAHAHDVAPGVAVPVGRPTVVCPDLRGYGKSSKPLTTDDHEPYSKRAMARDCVALMHELGHSRFAVVGHDRGGYVVMRLALDEPDAVTALVVLDIVPIGEALARCNAEFAERWYHWFFLAQPAPRPERAISAHPDAWYGGLPERMGVANWDDRRQAIHDPETVHAMCEDYRAGLGIDRAADDADRAAGRTITCPTLVLWAEGDDLPDLYGDVLEVWRPWAKELHGHGMASGHHMAEEIPKELAAELRAFLMFAS